MPVNSKQKGNRGEREFASLCKDQGYEARRGQQYCGLEGDDVVGLPNIHIECKRTEKLNIYDAVEQSVRDSKDNALPIVVHRRNNREWLVIMRAEDWFKVYNNSDYATHITIKDES